MITNKTVVMIFGTFDGVHEGHRYVFRETKKYGTNTIAVVARDDTVLRVKNKLPVRDEQVRLSEVMSEELISHAVLGNHGDKYKVLAEHKPSVVCLGYDQEHFTDDLRAKLDVLGLKNTIIVRLQAYFPEKYKSSILNKTHIN